MSDASRLRLTPILLEAGFVVLGVFLALVANEWRADANARARAEQARTGIVNEIRANRAAYADSRTYHAALLDSLRTRMAPGSAPPPSTLFDRGFVFPAQAQATAWEAARSTDVLAHLNFDEVLAFSRLYASNERYRISAENAGQVLFEQIAERGVPGVTANYRNLMYLIGSMQYLEDDLVAEHDSVLAGLPTD